MKCWVGVRAWDFFLDDHFARHQAVAAAAEEESPAISQPSPSKPLGPSQRASEWSNVESEVVEKAGWDRCMKTASQLDDDRRVSTGSNMFFARFLLKKDIVGNAIKTKDYEGIIYHKVFTKLGGATGPR